MVRYGLPSADMPEGIVGETGEDLKPTVAIDYNCRIAGDISAKRSPS
jgi:hypothetical protein